MNKFERGGEKELRKQLFGPPIGTLFLHGGKFPHLYILIGRNGQKKGKFLPIGRFSGGGGRKSRFQSVSTKDDYSWEYRWMRPLDKKNYDKIREDLHMDDIFTNQSWFDVIEERTGIKPIMPEFG